MKYFHAPWAYFILRQFLKCISEINADVFYYDYKGKFVTMDHSPIRQTFEFGKSISTAGKSSLNFIGLSSFVGRYFRMPKIYSCRVCEFCILFYYARKSVTTMWKCGNAFFPRNTKLYKICKLYITIFSPFYNIIEPNFTVSLNLASSFQLC